MTFHPMHPGAFSPEEKEAIDRLTRLEVWSCVGDFESYRVERGHTATFSNCWTDVAEVCDIYDTFGARGVRECYGVDLEERTIKAARSWCEHYASMVEVVNSPPKAAESSDEISVVKQIRKQGNSMILSITKEANKLGVGIGDRVKVTIRRM